MCVGIEMVYRYYRFTVFADAGESPEQILFLPDEVTQLEDALGSRSRSMFDALRKSFQTNVWASDQCLLQALKKPLKRLCARYLFVEKRRGFALNPVGKNVIYLLSVNMSPAKTTMG